MRDVNEARVGKAPRQARDGPDDALERLSEALAPMRRDQDEVLLGKISLARLVGTDEEEIVRQGTALLSNGAGRSLPAGRGNPYGDGLASDRIAAILLRRPFAPFVPPA